MCLQPDDYVQLGICPHGIYQLRVGNTSLHLTQKQVLLLHVELNRCIHTDDTPATSVHENDVWRQRFGQSSN